MRIRALYRTHYQVVEPRLFGLLITSSTSPIRSSYVDTVAKKLSEASRQAGKKLNEPAARYLVDAAKHFEFLDANLRWSWKGHVLALITPQEDWALTGSLTDIERIAYAKYYLESDGAALLAILAHISNNGEVGWKEFTETPLIERIFQDIISQRLQAASTIQERTQLRQRLDRLKSQPLQRKSRKHKVSFHLAALTALGLIETKTGSGGSRYTVTSGAVNIILDAGEPNALLEQSIRRDDGWGMVRTLLRVQIDNKVASDPMPWIVDAYRRIMQHRLRVCPISALIDFAMARGLSQPTPELHEPDQLIRLLRQKRAESPKDFRFHVDRTGQPAFVLISESALARIAGD